MAPWVIALSRPDGMGKQMPPSRRTSPWPLLLLALAGCAPPRPAPAGPLDRALHLSLPPRAEEVAAFRGHTFRRDVPVREVTRARLRRVIAAESAATSPGGDGGEAFLKAFGFIPLAAVVTEQASVRLQAEALVGLYVPRERAIYVRPRTRTSAAIDPDDVLHELAHALQDDAFGMEAVYAPGDEDARLARRAVYEGDATVVAWGVAAVEAGRSPREAIAEGRVGALAQSAMLGGIQDLEAVRSWESAPRITRMLALFPYTAGTELVAEAFLAGGNSLVDGLFRHLPVSTEQVLHAAKYFDGEAPIPVAPPAAPAGYVVRTRGTMGELRTRAFLEQTLPAELAVSASEGWGGDAYAVVTRGESGPLATLWSTVWDDAEHAQRFAAALEEATRRSTELGPVEMRRDGARVAWTRGLEGPGVIDALLALPGAKLPDRPPLGQVVLPSSQVAEEVLVPAGGDPHLVVAPLGLSARLPARFDSVRPGSADLVVQQIAKHGRGTVSHEAKPLDAAGFATTAAAIAPVFAISGEVGKMALADVALPIGPAKEARWRFADARGEARLLAAPLCGGEQTLYVMTVARTEETRVALDQWLWSLAPTGPGLPPICSPGGTARRR